MSLGAEVVWVNPVARDDAGALALGLGLRFSSIEDAVATRIEHLVESFRYRVIAFGLEEVGLAQASFGDLFPIQRVATLEALEEAARLGRLAREKFAAMGVEKMYCFMVVEASMFTDVLPKKGSSG